MDAPTLVLSPHARQIADRERARKLDASLPEMHRISCPYEPIGAAVVEVRRKNGEAQLPVGETVKCSFCGRYFEVAARISLYAKPFNPK